MPDTEITSLESLCIERQEAVYSDDECDVIQQIATAVWEQTDPSGETELGESESNRLLKDMTDAAKRVAADDTERRVALIAEGLARANAYNADQDVDEIADQLRFTLAL